MKLKSLCSNRAESVREAYKEEGDCPSAVVSIMLQAYISQLELLRGFNLMAGMLHLLTQRWCSGNIILFASFIHYCSLASRLGTVGRQDLIIT